MSLTAFPEPADLNIDFVNRIGDSRPKTFSQYSVENPHPGYGKDPNILNEFGHTKFPMFADKNTIVNNQAELDEYKAAKEGKPSAPSTELKQDGPTVEAYVKAGYKASGYPPAGYASKSSQEDINKAIAAEAWGNK